MKLKIRTARKSAARKSALFFFTIFLFFISSAASAEVAKEIAKLTKEDACKKHAWFGEKLQLQSGKFSSSNECFISILPRRTKNLIYRNFVFSSNGMIMVFNSFGEGAEHETTGARIYFLFPYRQNLRWSLSENFLLIFLPSNEVARFDLKSGQWVDLSNAQLFVDPKISLENKGGVELSYFNGLTLDAGFELGDSPIWDLTRMSTLEDSRGQMCVFKNKEVFVKKNQKVFLRKHTNEGIKKLIDSLCPNLLF